MTTIAIRDLPENTALDRQAMTAIVGGSRYGRRPGFAGQSAAGATRLFTYPAGFVRSVGQRSEHSPGNK